VEADETREQAGRQQQHQRKSDLASEHGEAQPQPSAGDVRAFEHGC
jgi:hypothetical protein